MTIMIRVFNVTATLCQVLNVKIDTLFKPNNSIKIQERGCRVKRLTLKIDHQKQQT